MLRTSRPFGLSQLVIAFGLVLLVTGCGFGGDDDPKPTATATPGPTVGELADRIAAAWSGVTTFRTVSGNAQPAGTPSDASQTGQDQIEVVTEVILPDRKHQISTSNGEVVSEFVVIGNQVFVRGPVTEADQSSTIQWRIADPSTLATETHDSTEAAAMTAPVQPPYSGLSQDERGRIAKPIGEIDINGQTCSAYQIADTTQTGERVDVTLTINADDLPCSIQTKVSGIDYVTTFEFNIPLTITPPIIKLMPFQ